ncbi:hypothetical protein [Ralstonia mannitolilytica]|uniref:Uncharacterized protein n=1 Tax=Ralstonia mannitolilytica TaxID=105219 RepID=A0AAD2B1A3_9RALS|nr:hypothetical protein [Ralstonia mannitolilytica]MBY4717386.1 hypothetical protein [Ralstonia mannitolilytica]CAJ0683468.1 hypothetical protein LMG18102_00006 [Ralstonia mannitolilytica]CAJ0692510.1 hypothetical protein R77591_03931 [Ralstonia mannitolilytica]CAJ0741492.1 hypothetical protein R76696_03495 [Ralstonia mannitolilytica]CAJ0876255.1 hypothetical protein R1479_02245 [Ralstonia mannitolilytica]
MAIDILLIRAAVAQDSGPITGAPQNSEVRVRKQRGAFESDQQPGNDALEPTRQTQCSGVRQAGAVAFNHTDMDGAPTMSALSTFRPLS